MVIPFYRNKLNKGLKITGINKYKRPVNRRREPTTIKTINKVLFI
jgi:hypothetical protein